MIVFTAIIAIETTKITRHTVISFLCLGDICNYHRIFDLSVYK
jgi:hypothetical protein